jgi:hypothetical protein
MVAGAALGAANVRVAVATVKEIIRLIRAPPMASLCCRRGSTGAIKAR